MSVTILNRELGAEGIIIFSLVGYETAALATNVIAGRRVLPAITDILGPLTHHRLGKVGAWLFLGWAFDHFWTRGEREIYGDLYRDNRHIRLVRSRCDNCHT